MILQAHSYNKFGQGVLYIVFNAPVKVHWHFVMLNKFNFYMLHLIFGPYYNLLCFPIMPHNPLVHFTGPSPLAITALGSAHPRLRWLTFHYKIGCGRDKLL